MAKKTPSGNIPSSVEVGHFLSSMRVASSAARPDTGMQAQPQGPPTLPPYQQTQQPYAQAQATYQQPQPHHSRARPLYQPQHQLTRPPYQPIQPQHSRGQLPPQQTQLQRPPLQTPYQSQHQQTQPPWGPTQLHHLLAQPQGPPTSQHPGMENSFQCAQNGRWNQTQPSFTNPEHPSTNRNSVNATNSGPRKQPPGNVHGSFRSSDNFNHHQAQVMDLTGSQIQPVSQRPMTPTPQYQSQRFASPPRPQFHHPSQPIAQPSSTSGEYSHPPLPAEVDSECRKESEEISQKQQDQNWVDRWLNNLNKMSRPPPAKTLVTIANFKCCLQEAFKLKDELADLTTAIEKDLESEAWQLKFEQINRTRLRLETLNKILTDEVTLENIKRLYEKRKTKRERLKRQRQEHYQERQTALARREALHRTIDQLQDTLLQQSQQEKQDREMKAAADRTLSEVRRKLTETSKTVELIKGLRKLRELRCKSFYTKGMYLGMESDDKFERQTENLLTMLENQTKIYETEEKTLKVMLETEQEETKEREREKKRQVQVEKVQREERQIRRRLFGNDDKLLESDPLLFYKQFYRQAETSLEGLVSARQGWDIFLVPEHTPGSSTVPQDWVWPVEPSSDIWASVMKQ